MVLHEVIMLLLSRGQRLQEGFTVMIGVEANTSHMMKPTSITNGFVINWELTEIMMESWPLGDDLEIKGYSMHYCCINVTTEKS